MLSASVWRCMWSLTSWRGSPADLMLSRGGRAAQRRRFPPDRGVPRRADAEYGTAVTTAVKDGDMCG